MFINLQFLCVEYVSGAAAGLVVSTENYRFLFDAGEGLQRLCVEHKVKLGRVAAVFITNVNNRTTGGLPGRSLPLVETCSNQSFSLSFSFSISFSFSCSVCPF